LLRGFGSQLTTKNGKGYLMYIYPNKQDRATSDKICAFAALTFLYGIKLQKLTSIELLVFSRIYDRSRSLQ
jgi:hypothetical protein